MGKWAWILLIIIIVIAVPTIIFAILYNNTNNNEDYINSHKTIHSSTTIPINLWLRRQNVLMDNGIDQA